LNHPRGLIQLKALNPICFKETDMNHNLRLSLVLALSIVVSACSGNGQSFFKNLDIKVSERNNESYVTFTSKFELGNVSLDAATYTIKDPHNGNQPAGKIDFSQDAQGFGLIDMEVNATLLVHADPDLGLSLPNGRPLPLSLSIERGDSFGVPVGEHSRVYLGGSLQTTIFAGVALAVKGLDQVMDQLSNPANVFFLFRPTNTIMGAGGIYGSPNPNQNGVALFGKYSKAGGMLDLEIDEDQDNEFYEMNNETQNKLIDFFYGEPKKLQVL
jgi:hypothetical protein